MTSQLRLALVIINVLLVSSSADRILFLLPLATRSHVHVFEPLMRALGERGHDVVALSPIKSSYMPSTVKQIQLITVDDLLGTMPDPFEQRKRGRLTQLFNTSSWDNIEKACVKVLKSPRLYDEVLNREKFDLIIVDIMINTCVLGIVPHFQAPSIFITTMPASSSLTLAAGNRMPQSFVSNPMLEYSDRMTFQERLLNALIDVLSSILFTHLVVKSGNRFNMEYLPNGENLPDYNEISQNVSMIFMNSHFTLTYPRPLLPDVIEVGGMHTRPSKKLPQDLDDFLSSSGDAGFIFFSLGSIVKPKEMPEATRVKFIKVFSKLKQRVLWKWDAEMPDAPPNVMVRKWLPQQDILGHPNIKLFMSHGGLLSIQESVYHGVPVLGLPVFADQDLNIRQAERGGYAKFIEIVDMDEEQLSKAINELIQNSRYSQRVKELSKLVRDNPQTPLEKAVFWTEYVLRHKGAVHLRSGARDLNFVQYYLLDVTAFILTVIALFLFLIVRVLKAVKRCICGKSKNAKRDRSKRE